MLGARFADVLVMDQRRSRPEDSEEQKQRQKQRAARREASADETLREQSKTETEQRPYLDTEGGE